MQGNKGKIKNEHMYENVPKLIKTSLDVKLIILWNRQVKTDRNIPNSKPDILSRDDEKGTCKLLQAAI